MPPGTTRPVDCGNRGSSPCGVASAQLCQGTRRGRAGAGSVERTSGTSYDITSSPPQLAIQTTGPASGPTPKAHAPIAWARGPRMLEKTESAAIAPANT
jgi:hypothetical protein